MKSSWVLSLFLFIAYAGILHAQRPDTTQTDLAKELRKIRPGDQLTVSVYGHDELPKEVRVEDDGTIKYPFMKDIKVDGLSPEQFANILSARLAQYIGTRAEVVVGFSQGESIEVVVLGQVNSPGSHQIPKNHTIQGAIAAAGGATARSNLDETKLIRRNAETGLRQEITVPVESIIIETGRIDRLPDLQSGDIIFVPAIYGATYANVLGAVRTPGNYPLFPGANVVDLVFLAGGPLPDASVRNIKLIRRVGATQTEQAVDIETVLRAKGGQVPLVGAGDIIFVPAKRLTLKTFFQVLGYIVTLLSAYALYLLVQERRSKN